MTMTQTAKPSEQRTLQRRQAKQQGRTRRAELMLDKQAKEKARQDHLDGRQTQLEARVVELEGLVAGLNERVQTIEQDLT